ncbi:MAG: hypothetical protein H6729_02525 [Deltaproteobacteria bacterium]|nr:hypothetical protein [Deltaproteobacteria bacterium]
MARGQLTKFMQRTRRMAMARATRRRLASLARFATCACRVLTLTALPLLGLGCGENGIVSSGRLVFESVGIAFDAQSVGGVEARPTRLTNGYPQDLSIRSIEFSPPTSVFAARLEDGRTLAGAILRARSTTDVRILFGPEAAESYASEMTVETYGGTRATVELSGIGEVIEPARPILAPSRIAFSGPIEIGREAVEAVLLTNAGQVTGTLSATSEGPFSVRTNGGGTIDDALPVGPGEKVLLEVRFLPTTVSDFSAALAIGLDGNLVTLPVSATSTPAGVLSCDLDRIDFGPVPRGQKRTQHVTCEVSGGQYTLKSVGFTGSQTGFKVENVAPLPGAQLRQLEFDVTFEAEGVREGTQSTLRVTSLSRSATELPVSAEVDTPTPTSTDLSVSLSWTPVGTDLDLHLVKLPGAPYEAGADCHWDAKTIRWGDTTSTLDDPFLDRDAVRGPGNEQINLIDAGRGQYEVWVQYFGFEGDTPPTPTAHVSWSIRGLLSSEHTLVLNGCGDMWKVGTFDYQSGTGVFTPSEDVFTTWVDQTFVCP